MYAVGPLDPEACRELFLERARAEAPHAALERPDDDLIEQMRASGPTAARNRACGESHVLTLVELLAKLEPRLVLLSGGPRAIVELPPEVLVENGAHSSATSAVGTPTVLAIIAAPTVRALLRMSRDVHVVDGSIPHRAGAPTTTQTSDPPTPPQPQRSQRSPQQRADL